MNGSILVFAGLIAAALIAAADAHAENPSIEPAAPPVEPAHACVNDRDLRRLVENRTVVAPIAAIRAARAEVAGEAVGARLCRDGGDYVYRVTVLTKDGRIVRVGVDGRTGRPADRR
jgi:uncharacterized membrane protein YkoI